MADLERRCRTCGQVAAHRKGDRLLALQHSVYVCVESLQTQLTHSQGRIAELEGIIEQQPEQVIRFICKHWYVVEYMGDSEEMDPESLIHWHDEWLGKEQQPTTLTKEGGGE